MGYMDIFREAERELTLADHACNVTLNVVKDRTVFLSVLSHLDKSVTLAIHAYLARERELRRIPMMPTSEELLSRMFFESYATGLGIDNNFKRVIVEIKHALNAQKSSRMGLERGNNYVLILPDFKTINIDDLSVKKYLSTVRIGLSRIEGGLKVERIGIGKSKGGQGYQINPRF